MKYFSRSLESSSVASFLHGIIWVASGKLTQKVNLKNRCISVWNLITVSHMTSWNLRNLLLEVCNQFHCTIFELRNLGGLIKTQTKGSIEEKV